ncbi:hypothetical protein E4U21_004093 [Claviceps maximensis]|nr:hypothetical protein E4U21_004093 [Claviceps maximensis]
MSRCLTSFAARHLAQETINRIISSMTRTSFHFCIFRQAVIPAASIRADGDAVPLCSDCFCWFFEIIQEVWVVEAQRLDGVWSVNMKTGGNRKRSEAKSKDVGPTTLPGKDMGGEPPTRYRLDRLSSSKAQRAWERTAQTLHYAWVAYNPTGGRLEDVASNDWTVSYQKAQAMVNKMTLEEKVGLTGGVSLPNGCSGNIAAIPRLGFPGLCLSDAGQGLRATDAVSGFASGIHVGASWNKNLTLDRGAAMGREFKRKGVNVLLGPVVGPAWSVVRGGRNWEAASADAYLSGVLAAQTVRGIQSANVMASTKHYIGNEQELHRRPVGETPAVSINIGDKAMHEFFLWPFQDAVKAGSVNIMCSYQRLNQTYACANDKSQNGLLKGELGFRGFILSDWDALYGGLEYATGGLDMGLPNAPNWEKNLVQAVQNGSFAESRVNDMATRIIAAWYQIGQDKDFPTPGIGMPKPVVGPHTVIEGRDPNDHSTILQGAIEGHVLVKNEKQTLPLRNLRTLSIFGYSANTPPMWSAAEDVDGSWITGLAPVLGQNQSHTVTAPKGTLFGAGGSGAITPTAFSSPQDALVAKAAKDGFTLYQDLGSSQPSVNPSSDACIVFGNAWASEGTDRPALQDDYTDTLIRTVASQCAKTIVVLHNAGIRTVDGFVDHPNVTALLFAHLPGQESGEALVSLLWGQSNPSGKLPYTVAHSQSDYGALLDPRGQDSKSPQADFSAGIYTDYKYFEHKHIQPRYEFGFGLSYTHYDYSELEIQGPLGNYHDEWPQGRVTSGGQEDLWTSMAIVSCSIVNRGPVDGAEVAQIYVRIPGTKAKQLRGFSKEFLKVGERARVTFALTRRDLSVWDTGAQKWSLPRGRYQVYVGGSSAKLPLWTTLDI